METKLAWLGPCSLDWVMIREWRFMTTLSAVALAVVEKVLDDLSQTLRTAREGDMVGES